MTILHIDSSARIEGSVTRDLTAQIVDKIGGPVIRRDLKDPLPQISESWVGANFTPADDRDDVQRDTLALSDTLVQELRDADTIVIGVPLYNFGIPAALKAWIDLVARAGTTFKYTESGPVGLLEGKKAYIAAASGGPPIGADFDFMSSWLRFFLGFLGIKDVEVIAADGIMGADAEAKIAAAIEKASNVSVAA